MVNIQLFLENTPQQIHTQKKKIKIILWNSVYYILLDYSFYLQNSFYTKIRQNFTILTYVVYYSKKLKIFTWYIVQNFSLKKLLLLNKHFRLILLSILD